MFEPDKEATSFITDQGHFYTSMPFGLKNTSVTYQKLVMKMFKECIGDTMEIYIDDMVVKSLKREDHLKHMEKAFHIL